MKLCRKNLQLCLSKFTSEANEDICTFQWNLVYYIIKNIHKCIVELQT